MPGAGAWPVVPSPVTSQDPRSALRERLAALEAKHTRDPTELLAADARRLGERHAYDDEDRARLASDPSVTHDQARATVRSAFPDAVMGDAWRETDDGQWLNVRTGEVRPTPNS